MPQNQPFAQIENRLDMGRFREARELLTGHRQELVSVDPLTVASLTTELDLASGDLEAARKNAQRQLREADSKHHLVTAHRVLGEVHANRLEFEESLGHYRAARSLCRDGVSHSLSAVTELSFWRWFSGVLPVEVAQAEFTDVLKAVARSAHPHHVAELRLCAVRVEVRKGSIVEARRHWELARTLLQREGNLKLQSQLELDGCMLALLSGDVRTALEHTDRALEFGQQAGYFRSSVAALIDRAHVLHATGDLSAARGLAETALSRCGEHKQLKVAALDCLANVFLASDDLEAAEKAFDEMNNLRPEHGSRLAPHWDVPVGAFFSNDACEAAQSPAGSRSFGCSGCPRSQDCGKQLGQGLGDAHAS